MATKTISLELDAYDKLRKAKRTPRESFSSVVRRARWPEERSTGPEALAYLRRLAESDPAVLLSEDDLSTIDARAAGRARRRRPRRGN